MAIYHLTIKPVKRGEGRAATAAAAYRAAELVRDVRTGEVFDYTRKRGVEHAEIVLPTAAARQDIHWARDRQTLWNAAEAAEKRRDARVAREYEVAVPHELTRAQRVELVRAFSQDLADRYGVAVDFAVHRPHREGDERNFHAHVLTTTRAITPAGFGDKTVLELGDRDRARLGLGPAREEIGEIRARWAVLTNERLQEHGHEARVDHRSLEAQGLERVPTVHLGPAVTALERRGIETEVGHRVRAEIMERLERAVELGRLERERQALQRSILDLSGDLGAARRDRDAGLTPRYDVEAERRQAREAWLVYRERQLEHERGGEAGLTIERSTPDKPSHERAAGPEHDFAL
jgi:ATP-dependent exoDNAse (exonuclease V) alpha subunit